MCKPIYNRLGLVLIHIFPFKFLRITHTPPHTTVLYYYFILESILGLYFVSLY